MSAQQTRLYRQTFLDGTLTDQHNLASMMVTKPEIMDTLVYTMGSQAAGSGLGSKYGVLQYITQGRGAVGTYEKVGSDQVQWAVQGKLIRSIPIVGASSATTETGRNFAKFTVPLSDRYFSDGFVCRFEDDTLARVCGEPYEAGNSWVYTFQIVGSNNNAFVDPTALKPGREIAWNFTAYEEMSHGGGSVEAGPSMFRNQLNTLRLSYSMSGSAKTDKIIFEVNRDGKKGYLWLYEKQWQFMQQWYRIQEMMLWGSRYNRVDDTFSNKGLNGRPVKMGSGLEEQLSGSNTIFTSKLSEDMLWHMLVDIKNNAPEAENRQIMLVTGDGGFWEFQQLGRRVMDRLTRVDTTMVHERGGNKLAFGREFVSYLGPDGTEFTLVNHPLFNDTSLFTKRIGPRGYTAQGYKMFFVDNSTYGGQANIRLLTKAANGESRQMLQWFTGGSTNLDFNGSANVNIMRSHDGDYASCHLLSEVGLAVTVPDACGMIQITPPAL